MNKTTKIILVIIGVIIVGLLIISNTAKKSSSISEQSVKIGTALAMTGDAGAWGEMEKKGIELKLEELKAKGTNIEIVYEDTKSTSEGTISAVQKLIFVDGVKYIIGPTWLDSYPGIQGIIKDKDVLIITPSASATAIQQPEVFNNLFSVWYRTDALTNGLAEYASAHGSKKIAIVFQNDAYYADFINYFKKDAEKVGIEIVSTDLLNPGQADTKTLLTKLKAQNIDAILFGAYDEKLLSNFLRDQKNILPNIALYSNDAIRGYIQDPNYTKLLEGAMFVENSNSSSTFSKKFNQKYSEKPNLSASSAYDTLGIFAELIAKEKTVSEMITMLKTKSFETESFGSITFDSFNGIVSKNKQYQVQKITNGTTEQIY